jgi:hypothetical protein
LIALADWFFWSILTYHWLMLCLTRNYTCNMILEACCKIILLMIRRLSWELQVLLGQSFSWDFFRAQSGWNIIDSLLSAMMSYLMLLDNCQRRRRHLLTLWLNSSPRMMPTVWWGILWIFPLTNIWNRYWHISCTLSLFLRGLRDTDIAWRW